MSTHAGMINIGDIKRRLVHYTTTAEHLATMITPSGNDKRSLLWNESDWPYICNAIADDIKARAHAQADDEL